MNDRSAFLTLLTMLLAAVSAPSTFAQLPKAQLDGLFPAGSTPGTTLEVTISGANLDDSDQLIFSHQGIRAVPQMSEPTAFDEGPQRVENAFVVTIDDKVPAGRYEVRSRGKYGLSNPRSFVVGTHTEIIEVEPNGTNELPAWTESDDGSGGVTKQNVATELALPATANGQLTGGADVDWYRFQGKAGSRVLLEGFAKRIDSRMDMIVSLYEGNGNMLGEGRPDAGGDPVLNATLLHDGEYFIKVHDALFKSGEGYQYRLAIGNAPHLDFVFPPAGLPGSNHEYTVYGSNLAGGRPSNWTLDGQLLERAQVRIAIPDNLTDQLAFSSLLGAHQGGMDGIEYRMTNGGATSNPLLLTAATAPVVLEQADNDRPETAQPLTPPCEVAGQFFPLRDVDWYTFEAKKDQVWSLDIISQRLGVASDPAMLIQRITRNEAGQQQVQDIQFIDDVSMPNLNNQSGLHEFDIRTTDPTYLFTAPADGTYRVLIKDGPSSVHSDPRLVYRFAIREPVHDFRIVAVPADSNSSLLLRRGLRKAVRVFVYRQDGYDGEIRVTCEGLPEGVTTEEIIIGPSNTMGTLILTTADDAPPAIRGLKITARANINGQEVVRAARYGAALETFQYTQPNSRLASVRSRLVEGIQLCVTDYDPLPLLLTIGDNKPLETSRGGVLKIPYQVHQGQGITANLAGFLMDFPVPASTPQVNIGSNEKGEFELRLQAATIPGTYSIYLAGFNRNYSYRRNPEQAEQAVQRQERIGKLFTEAQQKTRQAQQEVTKAQADLQSATNARNAAQTNKQQADQAATNAEAAFKTAEAQLRQKQAAAAASANDAEQNAQIAQAQADLAQAGKQLADAKTAAVKALTQLENAEKTLQTAEAAKQQADQNLQSANTFQQQAQQEKQRADQYANQKKNESNPRGINFHVPSNSLTIKVTEFPIKLETLGNAFTVKQGEKVEVPIKLSRLYDFNSSVSIQTQLPAGVGGISFQNINVVDNQTEGKFEVTAQPTATVGEHNCTVQLRMNFNGQNLIMEHPVTLTVMEVSEPSGS